MTSFGTKTSWLALPARHDPIRPLKDVGLIVDAEQGLLRFSHDRLQEYFLAQSLFATPGSPPLDTLSDLRELLEQTTDDAKMYAAVRLHFEQAANKFHIVEDALGVFDEPTTASNVESDEHLFVFGKRVLISTAESATPFIEAYIGDVLNTEHHPSPAHHRAAVEAAARLPRERSVPLLAGAVHSDELAIRNEANVFIVDRLTTALLLEPETHLLKEQPFASYFDRDGDPGWIKVARLLSLMGEIGPDNCHPAEYSQVHQQASSALEELRSRWEVSHADVKDISACIVGNRDRYIFNASEEALTRFFGNTQRAKLISVLDRLDEGSTLNEVDFEPLLVYWRTLDFTLEAQLINLLFALSGSNDFRATRAYWNECTSRLGNRSVPEEIDFFSGVALHLFVINGVPYDGLLDSFIDRILSECPDVVLYQPGLRRGYARGFTGFFDVAFEDGFNPFAAQAFCEPMIGRQACRFSEYLRRTQSHSIGLERQAGLLEVHLQRFLSEQRYDEAVRILHALGQHINLWPLEGFETIRRAVEVQEPMIRRAVVRILSETYARYPNETARFVDSCGSMFSHVDIRRIEVCQNPRIGLRQYEILQWARIVHFLLTQPSGRDYLVRGLRTLLRSESLEDAVTALAVLFGVHQLGT